MFLLAYRRFGKSCLIHETLRQLEASDHALTAYVDLYRANSERELWELFANALLAASRSPLKGRSGTWWPRATNCSRRLGTR